VTTAATLTDEAALRTVREGVDALRQGQAAVARERFQKVTQTGRANSQIWLLLAVACRALGDAVAEEAALDALLNIEPRNVRGRIMKGDCRLKAGDEGSARGFYATAVQIAGGQEVPADLVAELRRAEAAAADLKERVVARREDVLTEDGFGPERRSLRFQHSLDILEGRKKIYVQEPTSYYFPGLAQVEFFDPAEFAWSRAIEAAASVIRDEAQGLLASGLEGFKPYIRTDANRPRLDDNPLKDNRDWSALFLCENGQVFDEAVARCPRTWEAVQAVPLPHHANSPTVMFSLLRAGARIPAHTGTHNTRLVCHLPVRVPPACGFRVGSEVREWEEGKLLIFDDTIEHEAWNESTEDRLVLIFDIWRPELSVHEQREVASLFKAFSLE
jgi:tetratricopeptide (TPR) repeat protein